MSFSNRSESIWLANSENMRMMIISVVLVGLEPVRFG